MRRFRLGWILLAVSLVLTLGYAVADPVIVLPTRSVIQNAAVEKVVPKPSAPADALPTVPSDVLLD